MSTNLSQFNLFIGSHNAFQLAPANLDFHLWFGKDFVHEDIDMYAISLQELTTVDNVSQNPKPVDYSRHRLWRDGLLEFISAERKSQVKLIEGGNLGGSAGFLVVRSDFWEAVTSQRVELIECSRSKTTIKGAVGNRFVVKLGAGEVSFAFLGCHLTADQEKDNCQERVKDLKRLCSFQTPEWPQTDTNDFVCIFGDLNFRVYEERLKIVQLAKEKNWEAILKNDQLTLERAKGALPGFVEPHINFPPSYKYIVGSDEFNLTEPPNKLNPAYTDRVLYHTNKLDIQLQFYKLGQLANSDHKPVCALFKVHSKV